MSINPTKMGLMGAIAGGLQFLISDDARRRDEEAELVKLNRLEAIRAQTQQANREYESAEWQRRHEIESADADRRDQLSYQRDLEKLRAQQGYRTSEQLMAQEHDLQLEDRRTVNDLTLEEKRTRDALKLAREQEELRRTRPASADEVGDKALIGSDGKTYKFGDPLPSGVKIVGGYGVSFAPSESKSDATPAPGTRRSSGRTSSGSARLGDSEQNPLPVNSKEEAMRAPPGTWIRLPNGRVGQK